MEQLNKKEVVAVLNSLEVIETGGGDSAYVLVENNAENRAKLNAVGVTNEMIHNYEDEETFDILALGFDLECIDAYDGKKFICYDSHVEIALDVHSSIFIYQNEGKVLIANHYESDIVTTVLTEEEKKQIIAVLQN